MALHSVAQALRGTPGIEVYAQDISIFNGYGNFTGEVSANQVKDAGGTGCLIGHIERRTRLDENDNEINLKVKNALKTGLNVILSVGVTSASLNPLQQKQLIIRQLKKDLHQITPEMIGNKLCIAYESVATVSSFGKQAVNSTLPLADILEKIAVIRNWLAKNYPGIRVPLLYGGSVSPDNIAQFSGAEGLKFDGFLIGRESLDINDFKELISLSI
jgi:triosephosphate isomerase